VRYIKHLGFLAIGFAISDWKGWGQEKACAIMMGGDFDFRTHLDANGLRAAAIEVGYGH